MNMKQWLEDIKNAENKKAMPILSFPSVQLLDITVNQLISDSDLQAKGMEMIASKVDSLACVSMMDLSVEAEAFGCDVVFSDDEVPTITGTLITTEEEAVDLVVPEVGSARTGIYINAIRKAVGLINDRPVFAGVIGPFSLAGRLMDVTEAMINCYTEPKMVHIVLEKVTEFIIKYILEYKKVGANGVVMAEPLAGLLSPDLAAEFSATYVKQIVDAVQTDDFIVIYHNCGNNTIQMIDSIISTGSSAYHFGDAIDMEEMLSLIPGDIITMGNVSPSHQFKGGTAQSIKEETKDIMTRCCKHSNFVISSGCDIPPTSSWDNIEAFFQAVDEFYSN
ncbi:MAG: uroporphyrinogen decarboxylase family protein [Eubacteriales bacterium]|nr:uroporphyrinogen decarboxylase family protein [Eubacteriales bacterium]